ncbi:MAG: hypothetical protein DRQ88_03295 [Epsilonproteobacteria bacterium]|nr:MAG: hypothetical protein DRQ89_01465 [Campylobacterota bacterium]RLA67344.1 MAG: hypothetical protein DRQ88_03295 [Campylobacterota bacterium]
MFKLLIFFLFLPLASAEKKEKHNSIQVSPLLKSGRYLIYSCKKKFFACVDEFSYEACEQDRLSAIAKREDFLPCAPLKRFPHYDDCADVQEEKIRQPIKKRFCWYQLEKID